MEGLTSQPPMLPRVSVVIPFRNARRWLQDTLSTVASQEGVELELIVIDDGSTDHSLAVVETCWAGAPWPLTVIRSPGQGVSAARNLGWRKAKHPFIAFLDADDLMLPGRLAKQANLLAADPQLQHCLCGWQRLQAAGRLPIDVKPWLEGAGFSFEEALRHKAVLPSAWMLRLEALERAGGFDPALSQAEDVDLLLRLAANQAKGCWLQEILCGYRVHPEGASRRGLAQARSLSFVVERHLRPLAPDPAQQPLVAEVRYGTRAWLGWHAWVCGDQRLAAELWTTALGLSPMPAGLTWVHLAENIVRSAERIGEESNFEELLASGLWLQLSNHWWKTRLASRWPSWNEAEATATWGNIFQGSVDATLLSWSHSLREEIAAGEGFDWHPDALRRWCLADPALRQLRSAVLAWCDQLLDLPAESNQPERVTAKIKPLRQGLASLLLQWVELCWREDRRPCLQRLEQAIALWPSGPALKALARLQQATAPAGSQALHRLAERDPIGQGPPAPNRLNLPQQPVFWELPSQAPDPCSGPQCSPCIAKHLEHWGKTELAHRLVRWTAPAPAPADPSTEPERQVAVIPMGQVWLRPPQLNPWASTHAISCADDQGKLLPPFSSRYPQPWQQACPHAPANPEPPPHCPRQFVDATVVVLAGLSAETYYHWLLEVLPSLRLITGEPGEFSSASTLFWHNGGTANYVGETLQTLCGIPADRILDAQSMPWIQARRLVVITPPVFASPSKRDQDWLRSLVLTDAIQGDHPPAIEQKKPRPVWLWRGDKGRRPVFGERDVLNEVKDLGVEVMDGSKLTVQQQAKRLAQASVVIAPHGGAMTNLVFARPGTRVLELHHPDYSPPYFHSIIRHGKLQLLTQAQPQKPPTLYRDLLFESPATEPIILSTKDVVSAVRSLISTYNHFEN